MTKKRVTKKALSKKASSKKAPSKKVVRTKVPGQHFASRSEASEPPAARAWLVKSEPHVFSIDDLAKSPNQTTHWDGVRNFQARNTLRDSMQPGDRVLFYHSNCDVLAIVGTARVVRAGYPDPTAFDPRDPHFDPKSDPNNPRWFMVDIQLAEIFPTPLTLESLRTVSGLEKMELLRKGSRLSVQPVRISELETILSIAK